jgi:tetratricopeptide (TPR) repeat protein
VRRDELEAAADRRALAELLAARGRTREAQEALADAVAVLERVLGPDHYELALALGRLGELAERGGDPARASALYRRSLGIRARVLGVRHPEVERLARALARVQGRL